VRKIVSHLAYFITFKQHMYIHQKGERQLDKTRHTAVFYNKISRKTKKAKTENLSRDTHNYNNSYELTCDFDNHIAIKIT